MIRRAARASRGPDTTTLLNELRRLRSDLAEQSARTARWDKEIAGIGRRLRRLEDALDIEIERRRMDLDRIPELRAELEGARLHPDYELAYTESEPMVSVRIASYERTEELVEVALPSVLAQTYERLEVVVVNDGPNPRTREALARWDDPRVRFEELPTRGDYPRHLRSQWRVAGTPAANRALELCTGRWIAPLDDDDEFTPDHVETLLRLAQAERAELVWGALLRRNVVEGTERTIWSPEPLTGPFRFQGALYHQALTLFRYEPAAWILHEAGDRNLMRRMVLAGARLATTEAVVGTVNVVPVKHKGSTASAGSAG